MIFKAEQIVKVKSLGWFDENSSDNHLVEEHFIIDRDFFEKVANKNVEIFDVDNRDNSVYVKCKDVNGGYSYVWLPMRGIENKSRRKRIRKAKVRF